MKIGLITLHRYYNHGSVLQAFALKTYLTSIGFEVEIIDYWPIRSQQGYIKTGAIFRDKNTSFFKKMKILVFSILDFLLKKENYLYKFRRVLNFFLFHQKNKIRNKKFKLFFTNFFHINDCPTYVQGSSIPNNYDAYIYGSDQLWKFNENVLGPSSFNDVYWGKFPITNGLKIAYAASMGVENFDQNKEKYISKNIKNFNFVSVREDTLKAKLKTFLKKDIYHVLDPVFLLDKSFWEARVSKESKFKKLNYVLLYNLTDSSFMYDLASKIAKEYDCELYMITGNGKINFSNNFIDIDPIEFLELLNFSKFIISTSFHGVAFSLIFKKNFFTGDVGNSSSRINSLLRMLNLEDRYINNHDEIYLVKREIDYSYVSPLLQEAVDKSRNFLISSLND